MLICTETYVFLNFDEGVNQSGERYFAINVLDNNTKNKLSFFTKNANYVSDIKQQHFKDYQYVDVDIEFRRIFNQEKRTAYWQPELIGVKPSAIKE